MRLRPIAVAAAFAAAFTVAAPASAQFAKTEDAIKYRQSVFTIQANHMGRLAAMVRGERPFDAASAQASARMIETMSRLPWEAFVPNSGGAPSKVKPEAFTETGKVRELAERFQGEATKLVAASGSLDTLRQQLGATGASCKACHDAYRN